MTDATRTTVATPSLEIAYSATGPADGRPALLLHGWPDAASTWDKVLPGLHAAGYRTIVPDVRGFGGTRFLPGNTIRSGQYAAVAQQMAARPKIRVPTTLLHGRDDGATLVEASEGQESSYAAGYDRRVLAGVGHFPQRERPADVIDSVLHGVGA